MSELIKEIWVYHHYDKCLHGHDIGWSTKKCNCPIGKPFIEKTSLIKRHLFEAYGIDYNPNGMPREKVLEIINDWNSSGARASVSGSLMFVSKGPDHKIEKVTEQYPVRWVYFIDQPKWLLEAQDKHHHDFSIKYEANKDREEKEIQQYGTAMAWFYHKELESFIVPVDMCPKSPHYADKIPPDALIEREDWDSDHWVCPACNQRFVLAKDWKKWNRKEGQ